jgi:hypothetical protein
MSCHRRVSDVLSLHSFCRWHTRPDSCVTYPADVRGRRFGSPLRRVCCARRTTVRSTGSSAWPGTAPHSAAPSGAAPPGRLPTGTAPPGTAIAVAGIVSHPPPGTPDPRLRRIHDRPRPGLLVARWPALRRRRPYRVARSPEPNDRLDRHPHVSPPTRLSPAVAGSRQAPSAALTSTGRMGADTWASRGWSRMSRSRRPSAASSRRPLADRRRFDCPTRRREHRVSLVFGMRLRHPHGESEEMALIPLGTVPPRSEWPIKTRRLLIARCVATRTARRDR